MTREQQTNGAETIRVEGRVTGPWVDELARVADEALGVSTRLVLDLSGVTFVDGNGVSLLRRLRQRQAELRGSSRFVAGLLNGGSE